MKTRSLVPAVAATVLALALTGCGGDDEKKTDRAAADAPTSALPTPAGPPTVQVDEDNGSIKITQEDGSATIGKGLPEGFPTDTIPLVDGEVVGSTTGEAGGPYAWTVLLQVSGGTPTSVMAEVTRALTGAGFKATPGMAVPEMSTAVFQNPAYEVGVNAVTAENKVTVTYVVKKR